MGARLIEFGGWLMPVQYGSILEEHRAVRERVGLFDLSHMGELFVEGPDAGPALAAALVSNPPALAVGRAHYSMIVAPDGGVIDDLIVYRLAEERFLVVANASNAAIVSDALAERLAGFRAILDDRSLATGLLAVQGPQAIAVLAPLTRIDLGALRYYAIAEGEVAGLPALVARTGYTGEDGFEVILPAGQAPGLWQKLANAGARPAGLGARDTLRLEAGLHLYGEDMNAETTAVEASLGWAIAKSRRAGGKKEGGFPGSSVYLQQSKNGVKRKLIGLTGDEPVPIRHGSPILSDKLPVGVVTSGTVSPSAQRAIMLGYVETAALDKPLAASVRGQPRPIRRATLPFVPKRYKR
jgi:aminomethyltransferase